MISCPATGLPQLIDCNEAEHAEAIRVIFNHAIEHSTALYEYAPRSAERIRAWFAAKREGGSPALGAIDSDGQVLGFAT